VEEYQKPMEYQEFDNPELGGEMYQVELGERLSLMVIV